MVTVYAEVLERQPVHAQPSATYQAIPRRTEIICLYRGLEVLVCIFFPDDEGSAAAG